MTGRLNWGIPGDPTPTYTHNLQGVRERERESERKKEKEESETEKKRDIARDSLIHIINNAEVLN